MKRNFLLKILASSTLFFNLFCLAGLSLPVCAVTHYDIVTSPSLNCTAKQKLMKGDGSGLLDILTTITQKDQLIELKFNEVENEKLPALEKDESYFAVLTNKEKGVIGQEFLTADPQDETKLLCNFDVPYYCDVVDVHIYKQKNSDYAFKIEEKNFIGRTKILMTHDAVYTREDEQKISAYTEQGIAIVGASGYVNRITPNFYSIKNGNPLDVNLFEKGRIGKIVLPEDKQNLMDPDDTVVLCSEFHKNGVSNGAAEGFYYNFRLPDGVDEFTFKIYNGDITDNNTNLKGQFKIKLKKVENQS